MNNNIVFFRGRSTAATISIARIESVAAQAPRMTSARHPALVAVWHTNPFSGKLECLWTTGARATADEDHSRDDCERRAA